MHKKVFLILLLPFLISGCGTSSSSESVTSEDSSTVVETHVLAWDFSGGEASGEYTLAGEVEAGSKIVAPTLIKEGYQLKEWTPSFTGVMPNEDVTYKAIWSDIVLSSPDNGKGLSSGDITFKWKSDITTYQYYEIFISTSTTFASEGYITLYTDPTYKFTINDKNTYYWKVVGHINETQVNESAIRSFSIR